ncbi:hypothetical protein [Propionispira raffinosivorans]|jgi:hypothetical protein|uniref:hypothetical protein n=1 Tax=Propionispira raffinosivorans TaxID=86959 RepID=UPI00036F7332|nr:hypothetical protein [Propionispira raffinosivorans]
MTKYRKKPIEIEAFQFDGDFVNGDSTPAWAWEAIEKGEIFFSSLDRIEPPCELFIKTLEENMHASMGDYIIRGISGEIYPCKPDIFEKTYESVE